jgi:putative flippase GtrA
LSSYAVNIIILAALVELMGLSHFMAQVVTSALVAVLNYFLVKIFVFRQNKVK